MIHRLITTELLVRGHSDRFAGIDWGRKREVIIRLNQRELWRMRRGSCWGGVGCERRYVAVELALYDHSKGLDSFVSLQEGGRLTQALIDKYIPQIDEFFKQNITESIVLGKTLTTEKYLADFLAEHGRND